MSAYAAPIEVVQAALHRCGEESIASLTDGSPASMIAASNYEGIVQANLTRHAWLFSTETINLTLVGPVIAGNFLWAWTWGPEVLGIRWAMCAGRRLRNHEYILEGRQILTCDPFTNAGFALQAKATFRAGEGVWPGDFAEAMVTRLEGLFLGALADNWQAGQAKNKIAEDLFKAAIVRDKRQQPAISQEYNVLAEAHRYRGRRSRFCG